VPHHLKFRILEERLAVCRLSVVCSESVVPKATIAERGWLALRLEGPFPFSLSGVLASFARPLAQARIGIFAISTFDTDYILIKKDDCEAAMAALETAGHENIGKNPSKQPSNQKR
jgi:hypothetical protein